MQETTTHDTPLDTHPQDTPTQNHHLSPQAAPRGGSQSGQDDEPKEDRGLPTRGDDTGSEGGSGTGTDDQPKPDRGATTRSDGGTDGGGTGSGGSGEGGSQTGGDTGTKSDRGV